jgi:hypothetical protein
MSGTTGLSAREVIMARIKEALRMPAPLPHGLADDSLAQVRLPAAALATSGG